MIIDILRRILKKIKQELCGHNYVYLKSEFIGGRRCSIHYCNKCDSKRYDAYMPILERDQLLCDIVLNYWSQSRW